MRGAPTEVDIEIQELEARLERLRSLYDQYFVGIERLEPTIPRKDVDRRIQALTRARLRNTAKRFKFQTIVQRYNTYQQYWTRTCREIENGTYARHVARAKSRFGNVTGAVKKGRVEDEEAAQKTAERRVEANRAAEEDLAALLKEDLSSAMDNVMNEVEAVTQRRPPMQTVVSAPSILGQSKSASQPSNPQQVSKDRVREALAANPPRRRADTRPEGHRSVRAPASTSIPAPVASPAVAPPPRKATAVSGPPKPPPRAASTHRAEPAQTPEARAKARPAAARLASALNAKRARATTLVDRPAVAQSAPVAKPTAVAKPVAAPKPVAAKAALLSKGRMETLHQTLVSERGRLNQKGQVSQAALEKSLRATEAKLRQKYAGRKIDFQVVVKNGKAIVKPIVD